MNPPAPPRRISLTPESAWRCARCWECDELVTDDEAVIWDGRIWHINHWRGDLSDVRHDRAAGNELRTTTCSGAEKPRHKG